jgi:hypothetical protein
VWPNITHIPLFPLSRSPADSYSKQRAIDVILISLALCGILFAFSSTRRVPTQLPAAPIGGGVGSPRKHMPRKKIPADLRSLARGHTEQCIKVLAGMLSQEAVPAAARVSAATLLLDRGWGRAPQAIIGANGEGDIKVTIRHILEHIDETPMTIAGEVVRHIDADATVEDQVDQS